MIMLKRLRHTILYPLLCLLVLTACEEDELPAEPVEPEPENFCYLQEQMRVEGELRERTVYRYNEQNQVDTTEHYRNQELTERHAYTYNSAGKLVREDVLEPTGELRHFITYSYAPSGRLSRFDVQQELALGAVHKLAAFKAVYDNNGRLTSATDYLYLSNQLTQSRAISFSYPLDKNPTLSASFSNSDNNYTGTYSLDGQRGVFSSMQDFAFRKPGLGYPFEENLIALTAQNTAKENLPSVSYETQYVYNNFDFPVQAIRTYGDNRTETITYTYRCE